jgi:hypothetical protein
MNLIIILGMFGFGSLVLALLITVIAIIVIRLFGAWMLRINEVINLQREILEELKRKDTIRLHR